MKVKNTRTASGSAVACATALVFLSSSSQPVHAEGHRDNFKNAKGVNRVVRSTAGTHRTIEGYGSMNFINVPPLGGRYIDKPSFYLGTTVGADEVDAGLQYEPKLVNNVPAGWSAFISISRGGDPPVYTNPRVLRTSDKKSIAWRGGPVPVAGRTISSSIESKVEYETHADGMVSINMNILQISGREAMEPHSGTFFYNITGDAGTDASSAHPIAPWYGQEPVTGNQTAATVKRVIAMTRDNGGSANDGSQLTGSWIGTLGGPVNQDETGYDAPGNGSPGQKDGGGAYKVNFPKLDITEADARADTQVSYLGAEGSVSRYSNETVSINLRRKPPRGRGR